MKPERITNTDWNILKKMYPSNLEKIVKKIEENYPVQYLIGYVDFCDTTIEVNENVLIPRFETEYLVEKVIKKLQPEKDNTLEILDIGTGSGCIIISLAKKLNQSFTAFDISSSALEVAKTNAIKNDVNINFKEKNILKEKIDKNYDVIISNPPYVDFNEKVDISTKFEPQNAIFAEKQGMEFYERIINIIDYKPKLIAFEIGCTQGEKISKIAAKKFPNAKIWVEKDLCQRDRYLFIEN